MRFFKIFILCMLLCQPAAALNTFFQENEVISPGLRKNILSVVLMQCDTQSILQLSRCNKELHAFLKNNPKKYHAKITALFEKILYCPMNFVKNLSFPFDLVAEPKDIDLLRGCLHMGDQDYTNAKTFFDQHAKNLPEGIVDTLCIQKLMNKEMCEVFSAYKRIVDTPLNLEPQNGEYDWEDFQQKSPTEKREWLEETWEETKNPLLLVHILEAASRTFFYHGLDFDENTGPPYLIKFAKKRYARAQEILVKDLAIDEDNKNKETASESRKLSSVQRDSLEWFFLFYNRIMPLLEKKISLKN